MTADQLAKATGATKLRAGLWLRHLLAVMALYDVSTPARRAAFLAQVGVETAGLVSVRENLNYSPEGILRTFNTLKTTRFTVEEANRYGRTPGKTADQVMIANIAYANRYGNGPRESGDGWRYRGGGAGHLTFKDNYQRCGEAIGRDLVNHPESIEQIDIGCLAFGWYWVQGNPKGLNLNHLADTREFVRISQAVNGGNNGLSERLARTERNLVLLA